MFVEMNGKVGLYCKMQKAKTRANDYEKWKDILKHL